MKHFIAVIIQMSHFASVAPLEKQVLEMSNMLFMTNI